MCVSPPKRVFLFTFSGENPNINRDSRLNFHILFCGMLRITYYTLYNSGFGHPAMYWYSASEWAEIQQKIATGEIPNAIIFEQLSDELGIYVDAQGRITYRIVEPA